MFWSLFLSDWPLFIVKYSGDILFAFLPNDSKYFTRIILLSTYGILFYVRNYTCHERTLTLKCLKVYNKLLFIFFFVTTTFNSSYSSFFSRLISYIEYQFFIDIRPATSGLMEHKLFPELSLQGGLHSSSTVLFQLVTYTTSLMLFCRWPCLILSWQRTH